MIFSKEEIQNFSEEHIRDESYEETRKMVSRLLFCNIIKAEFLEDGRRANLKVEDDFGISEATIDIEEARECQSSKEWRWIQKRILNHDPHVLKIDISEEKIAVLVEEQFDASKYEKLVEDKRFIIVTE